MATKQAKKKEEQTLQGKVIISARPVTDNDTLKKYLSAKGAKVIDFPMIEFSASEIDYKIKNIFNELDSFHWLVFTSRNGVDYFFQAFSRLDSDKEALNHLKIAVVGKATAEEVRKYGLNPTLISSGNTSDDLMKELEAEIQNSVLTVKLLLSLGSMASDSLEKGLSRIADVTRINLYETSQPQSCSAETLSIIKNSKYNIITFTSPSQVQNFIKILNLKSKIVNSKFKMACIGKTTEKEILKHGMKPVLVSTKSDGLIFAQEIEHYLITNH